MEDSASRYELVLPEEMNHHHLICLKCGRVQEVEFIPNIQHFVPLDIQGKDMEENVLRIEEVEAIRLKDVEKLEQEECAEKNGNIKTNLSEDS